MDFNLNEYQANELANRIVEQLNKAAKKNGKAYSPIYETFSYKMDEDSAPEISLTATVYSYEDDEIKDAIMRTPIAILVTDFAISVLVHGLDVVVKGDDMMFFKIYYQFMSEQFDNYLPELRKYLNQKKFNSLKEYYKEFRKKERELLSKFKKYDDALYEIEGQNINKN